MSKLNLGSRKAADAEGGQQRMETCSCMVNLGGDIRNQSPLTGVTVPELILLRAIHGGAETVVNVQRDGESRDNNSAERMRLLKKYPRHAKMIVDLFPGLSPDFPRTLAEADDVARLEQQTAEDEAESKAPQYSPPVAQPVVDPVDG